MALVTTPGDASADSYASVVEADAYHLTHLYASVWTLASETIKEQALQMAARLLDGMPGAWTGAAAASTQALGWPRSGMLSRNGFAIEEDAIPNNLKYAQSEYARQLIAGDRTADNSVIAQGITGLTASSVSLQFKDTLDQLNAQYAMVPDAVHALLVDSWLETEAEVRGDDTREGLVAEVL